MSPNGQSGHFAAAQQLRRVRNEADTKRQDRLLELPSKLVT